MVTWAVLFAAGCGMHKYATYESPPAPALRTATLYSDRGLEVGLSVHLSSGATAYEIWADFLRRNDAAPEWDHVEVQLEWDDAGRHIVVPAGSFELLESKDLKAFAGDPVSVKSAHSRSLRFRTRQSVPAIPPKGEGMVVTVTFTVSRDGHSERVKRRARLERHDESYFWMIRDD